MKKALILLTLILVSLPVLPQGRKYQKGMLKAIRNMEGQSDPASLKESAAAFEAFGETHPTEWIPYYYASLACINASFEESDVEARDQLIDRAQKSLAYALKIAPQESELHVLQAYADIGRISVDPEIRGPEIFEDVLASLDKAAELNPENPRGAFLQAMMALNMPDFLGGGPEAAKPLFLEAEKKFKTFTSDNPLWPGWGIEDVQAELERLKDL